MRWWTFAIGTFNLAWPTEKTTVDYDGNQFLLSPESDDLLPSVSIRCPKEVTQEEVKLSVNRFLSSLCWAKEGGAHVLFGVGSSGRTPTNAGKSKIRYVCHRLRTDYLPKPNDEKAYRALALFREALSVNTIPYQFLGFYKVINVLFDKGNDQKAWINTNITNVKDFQAVKRIEDLKKTVSDFGEYLYESGRCAVAHAFAHPTVDPDIPSEISQLAMDLPIVRALAKILIETELNVITEATYRQRHLYELQGFADIIGSENVRKLKAVEPIHENLTDLFPTLSIRLREHDHFKAFESMTVKTVKQIDSNLFLLLQSQDGLCIVELQLNFAEWRLVFNSDCGIDIKDDNEKTVTPIYYCIDRVKFLRGHLLNGQVEIYNASTNRLLARTDPLLPCNIDIKASTENLDTIVDQYEKEISARKEQAFRCTEDKCEH
jgi:hypothetical protein